MRPQRLLLLSYAFPPMAVAPEAVLSAKRLGNVPDVEVDVISAAPFGNWRAEDHSLDRYVAERFARVTRVPMPRLADRLPDRLGVLGRIPHITRLMNPAVHRIATRRGLERYSALVTWSQWHSAHLAGLGLIRRSSTRLPWIAHFSDPWSDNPMAAMRGVTAMVNRRQEARVVAAADRLLFTSEETVRLVMGKYPGRLRDKVRVLPHAYEPSLYPAADRAPRSGPLRIRYLGHFYGRRTPEPLFQALARLHERQAGALRDVRVELVGRVEPRMLATSAARAVPPGVVTVREPVGYGESLRLMRDADVLLVIDAPATTSPFLPSKLVDYVGAARPIVAITPPGAARSLVDRLGGWTADPLDPAASAHALTRAIDGVAAHRDAEFGEPAVRREYRADVVGRRMADVIAEVSPGRPPERRP